MIIGCGVQGVWLQVLRGCSWNIIMREGLQLFKVTASHCLHAVACKSSQVQEKHCRPSALINIWLLYYLNNHYLSLRGSCPVQPGIYI